MAEINPIPGMLCKISTRSRYLAVSDNSRSNWVYLSIWALMVALLLIALPGYSAAARQDVAGAVYVMTNDPAGNEVVIFNRDAKGILTRAGSNLTGGLGSGGGLDPLQSQGSLRITADNRWVLAVNAGSNEISAFRVLPDGGLALTDTVDSGGEFPTSSRLIITWFMF